MTGGFSQLLVATVLSSGFMSALIALFSKKLWSPESKNELARLGNEFAHQLLMDAKMEREELRITIRELETESRSHTQTIERLKNLLDSKDAVIRELESRQVAMAEKLRAGQPITLRDIFGDKAPPGYELSYDEVV